MQDNNKIPTDKGHMTTDKIMNTLMWGSYKANRDAGLSHDQLINIGIGNNDFKIRYELEQKGIELN